MTDTLHVITICGSLRKDSWNAALARNLPKLAPPGLSIAPGPEFGNIPLYNADEEHPTSFPVSVLAFTEAIRAADGVILVSPEYNWSIPGPLKNAIDWASRVPNQPFADKPIALQSAAIGLLGGARMQYHLRQALMSINASILVRPEVFVTFAERKFDADGNLLDETTVAIIKQQLATFEKFMRRHIAGRETPQR